jgi:hypothetical protein
MNMRTLIVVVSAALVVGALTIPAAIAEERVDADHNDQQPVLT